MTIQTNRGIGIFAIIVIIAILAVGGIATFQISKEISSKANIEAQQEDTVNLAKKDVIDGLLDIKTTLESNLALEAKLNTAWGIISVLNGHILAASVGLEGEAKTELNALTVKIAEIEAKIKTNAQSTLDDLTTLIIDISASISEDDDSVEMNADYPGDDNDSTEMEVNNETEAEAEVGGSMMTEDEANANGSTTVETETTVDVNLGN